MPKKPSGGIQTRLNQSFSRIPSEDTPRIYRIRLEEIELNPDQPRKRFDEESLQELAATIERHGLIQPITVKRMESGRYLLVSGERRFRAHQLTGREEILAMLTTGNPDEIALIENVQRQDLHPLEEAAAYARMMERYGWTQEEVAEAVGKARPTVTNILKLNELPDAIKAECSTSNVSKSVLLEIARVASPEEQHTLWEGLKSGQTSVRATRERKKEPTPRVPPSEVEKTISAGRSFARRLEGLTDEYLASNQADYAALLALSKQIAERLEAARRTLGEPVETPSEGSVALSGGM